MARGGRHKIAHLRCGGYFLGSGPRHQYIPRRALLQEKFCRLHNRCGVKAAAHRAIIQRIGERDQKHALMVRHVGANDGDVLSFRQAGARVIERLVEAIVSERAFVR